MRCISTGAVISAPLLVLSVAIIASAGDVATDRVEKTGRQVCGPLCVHWVLQYYGQDVDPSSLVYEMQWPDLHAGASLAQLNSALTDRGVRGHAAKISCNHPPAWDFPVILYLAPIDRKDELGHFVVWDPRRSEEASVWDCDVHNYVSWASIKSRFTGVVLLTSSDSGGANGRHGPYVVVFAAAAVLCGAAVTLMIRRLR